MPVLSHVNLTVEKGSITGLMGPSGCGKSTLLKMLLRFYDPEEGSVYYKISGNRGAIGKRWLRERIVRMIR